MGNFIIFVFVLYNIVIILFYLGIIKYITHVHSVGASSLQFFLVECDVLTPSSGWKTEHKGTSDRISLERLCKRFI